MTMMDRRTFLQSMAAAGASTILPESIQKALAIEPNVVTGTIQDVQHIVILMQENRSFDHYFGTLRGVRGFDDPAAMVLRNGTSVFQQPAASGSVWPFHMDTATTSAHCFGNQANNWRSNHDAWNGGGNDGWVAAKSPLSMGYFTRGPVEDFGVRIGDEDAILKYVIRQHGAQCHAFGIEPLGAAPDHDDEQSRRERIERAAVTHLLGVKLAARDGDDVVRRHPRRFVH